MKAFQNFLNSIRSTADFSDLYFSAQPSAPQMTAQGALTSLRSQRRTMEYYPPPPGAQVQPVHVPNIQNSPGECDCPEGGPT